MRRLATWFLLLSAVALSTGCMSSLESTEVGVRTAKLGIPSGRGVKEDIYTQGTYFFLRAFNDFHVYDTSVQNLEMFRDIGEGDRSGDDSLRFKTVDGNDISVDVTIAWSIDPDRVHYVLKFVGSSTEEVEEKMIRPVARTVVRDVLNQLTSEEFYQADRRFEMGEEAKARLNVVLSPEGIIVENVLLGEHRFNVTYEEVIRDKKVAEQEAARLVSGTESAREEMIRDLEKAKGAVAKDLEEARGESEKRTLEADAIFFERAREAEAIVAEKKAAAEGLTEMARALSGAGGRSMVKLKVAEALKGKKILFIPAGGGIDMRNTDVNDLLKLYGVKSLGGAKTE